MVRLRCSFYLSLVEDCNEPAAPSVHDNRLNDAPNIAISKKGELEESDG